MKSILKSTNQRKRKIDSVKESVNKEEPSSISGSEADEDESSSIDDESDISDDDEIAQIGRQNIEEMKMRKRMKKSREADDGSESFSKAMNALLDTHLKAHDRQDPILARSKGQIKKFEEDKLESKAKKLLLAKKKAKLSAGRRIDLIPSNNTESAQEVTIREKKLRKVAQRGVIKLFNAILAAQTPIPTDDGISQRNMHLSAEKRKAEVTEVSRDRFLDMVQAAAQK